MERVSGDVAVTPGVEGVLVSRNLALDFTKGILVVCMILYHSLNYLDRGAKQYAYLAFLPPSFILITGFIVSNVYIRKYQGELLTLGKRLWIRSFKILCLFLALNLIVQIRISQHARHIDMIQWVRALLGGNHRQISFDVLLPIALVLLIASVLAYLDWLAPHCVLGLAVAALLSVAGLGYRGQPNYNLSMVSVGVLGMGIGFLSSKRVDHYAANSQVIGLLAISYPLCLAYVPDTFVRQTFLTVAGLIMIYGLALRADLKRSLYKHVRVLGQYSLFGYVFQILWLNIVFGLSGHSVEAVGLLGVSAGVLVALGATVAILGFLRRKYRAIDILYRTVFA